MHALVFGKARMAARTLLARAGGVFMWPGIALTERRGAACVPIAADIARFWISRLHGPEANDSAVLRCLAIAAQKLSEGDEAGAQRALDASGPIRLSADGVVLVRAVAGSLGIGPLDLPWAEGPRLWRAEDIAAHLPLFKDYAPTAGLLAKAGPGTSLNIRAGLVALPIIKVAGSIWRRRTDQRRQVRLIGQWRQWRASA